MIRTLSRAACLCAVLALTGCGTRYVPVNGVVKLDGNPVEGATVVFTSEDGSRTFSGLTDAKGEFTLAGGDKPGATPGTYKVTVTRAKAVKGAENMTAGGDDYIKHMKAEQKEQDKATKGMVTPMPGAGGKMMMPGAGGKMGMPGVGMPGQELGGVKTDLPKIYAATNSTPLSVKVPPDNLPVVLDLKSK